MNKIDISIEEIIEQPRKVITDTVCCWQIIVKTNCYGVEGRKTIRATDIYEIQKYKPGYVWSE